MWVELILICVCLFLMAHTITEAEKSYTEWEEAKKAATQDEWVRRHD